MLIESKEGSVAPDYFQFYVKTPTAEWASDRVTEAGYEAHLEATSRGFIYVGTLKRFLGMPVRLEVHDSEPRDLSDDWAHVAEVSFEGHGRLEVQNWGGDLAFAILTPDGSLRLRAGWAGLERELSDGLREDSTSDERIVLQIWPAPVDVRRVLRWWPEWERKPPTDTAPDGRRQIEGQERVVEALSSGLRPLPVDFIAGYGQRPALPGGKTGQCAGIFGDPRTATWWIDGYDERRVLRVATPDEVRQLLVNTRPSPIKRTRLPDPRWDAMLASVGLEP